MLAVWFTFQKAVIMGEEDGGSISHVVYHMTNPNWIPNIIWD